MTSDERTAEIAHVLARLTALVADRPAPEVPTHPA